MLNVHEIPIIANRKGPEIGLQTNMIVTIEPGFYEDNKFGIRIENCVRTVKANTKYLYASNVEFLTFEPLTFVPIQRELIDKSLLTSEEINWLDQYHQKCLTLIGQELKRQNKLEIYEWLMEETKPI
jgi:Xaa-Pro aminopeptidase